MDQSAGHHDVMMRALEITAAIERSDNWNRDLTGELRERIASHYQIPLNDLLHEQRAPPDNPHPRDIDNPF